MCSRMRSWRCLVVIPMYVHPHCWHTASYTTDDRWHIDGAWQIERWHVRCCEDFLPCAKLRRVWLRGLTRSTGISYLSNTCLILLLKVSVTNGNWNEKDVSRDPLFVRPFLLRSTAFLSQDDGYPLSSFLAKVELMASSRCSAVLHLFARASSVMTVVVLTELPCGASWSVA